MTKQPKRILAWSDSSTASTGFGTVAKHVLTALHKEGYEIDHLAINFHGDFVDKDIVPWQVQPAKMLDPKDPHGTKMFIRSLMRKEYDYVWVNNDLFVTQQVVALVQKAKETLAVKGQKIPKIIYYYPVDCSVPADKSEFVRLADVPVCYTTHGREETLKTFPEIESKLVEIPHGVDTSVFHPLSDKEIDLRRKQILGVGPGMTVVTNVNRNSQRKQMQYTLLAFKEFRKRVPNSILYLHTAIKDQGGDLSRAINELGFSTRTDVIHPTNHFSASNGVPVEALNAVYNSTDIFLSTHLGEGWGLTITEAMAAGVPVVCPNNTCMPQQLGENSERGYMYECRDTIWIDDSGYRAKGLIPDIVGQMTAAYHDGPKKDNPKVTSALEWARGHDWKEITVKWVELFKDLETRGETEPSQVFTEEF